MGIESNQDEFAEFEAAGEVEVGKPAGEAPVEEKPKSRAPKPAPVAKEPVKPAADDDDDDTGGDDDAGDDGDDDGEDQKPKKSAKDHQIERLKREKSDLNKRLRALEGGAGSAELARRLENIEKGLSGSKTGDNQNAGKPAPDPTDSEKYPLGHLDDRYIEDKIEWAADRKAEAQADAVLQRQQEGERNQAIERQQADLLEKVETLSVKGSELFDDFEESVVETGMRGDWKLQQPTFEACHEADNGAQILYNLSQDPKEALRVSKLSPYQQLKYVQEQDAAIGTGKKGRTKPQAGDPPKNTARGANSRTEINPATENLDDFEKAWKRDEKRSH